MGTSEDGPGRGADFTKTVNLLIYKVGTKAILTHHADPDIIPKPPVPVEMLRPVLKANMPAFLN